jgi:hypothetical protein
MKRFYKIKAIALLAIGLSSIFTTKAQVCEWRLVNPVYSSTDPDGGGLAVGSVTFTLQLHTVAGSVSNVNAISVGWAYQNANTLLPTGMPCGSAANQPSNVVLSTAFTTAGFQYNTVNECSGTVNFSTGGQTFDRRSAGTLENGLITLTTAWVDVFTVTLWSRNSSAPFAGYAVINSGNGGSPGAFGTYAVADQDANEYVVNSLTYTTPLALAPIVTPVLFTYFNADCNDKGALLSWETATEENADYYEIQRSADGGVWKVIDRVDAAGNSSIARQYQYLDLEGGNVQYRLRQVDLDGKETFTGIRRTNCEGKTFSSTIYPVPAKDKITLVVRSDKAATTNLQILDVNGRMVKQVRTNINNGNTNIAIDVSSLPQGEYILISADPSVRIAKKFVVAR